MTGTVADVGRTDERAKELFDLLCDDVDRRLNPNDDECWHCGGEGYVADCIDGFCVDAESGCDDCTRRCRECVINASRRAKEIREEVIISGDINLAREWLKSVGRWSEEITSEQISKQLEIERATLTASRVQR